ncbi:F0F1 ATP synthase subunit A [Nonomuraea zeae]|uniref:F0F1 ATP synthase subunit A n=1 Tax=Nonomuraea zeae TaxID=1642303 RepID=UPI0014797831|nr:F0F1 ATP synthase subunit A [Nonomuraea zeae]
MWLTVFPAVLVLTVYGIKLYLGIRRHGVRGYLRGIVHLPGLPGWAYGLYAPLVLAEVFLTSLFTHFIRLFANMFCRPFLFEELTPLGAGLGVLGVLMTIVMTVFEMFMQFLRTFLFAMLAGMFIASGLRGAH